MCLTALTSEAQYKKLLRGEPNPFDTAVAVRIDRYRQEGIKLKLGQQLVDSLVSEIKSLHAELETADQIAAKDRFTIATLEKANHRKDSVNVVLVDKFDELYQVAKKPDFSWKSPTPYLIVILIVEALKLIFQ